MDRGYMDFSRLAMIANAGAFFVTRAKANLQFKRHRSQPVDRFTGLRSDHVGKPAIQKARTDYPMLFRMIPEPSSSLIGGLGLLALLRRRR
jgi:PEP-CTERM motif